MNLKDIQNLEPGRTTDIMLARVILGVEAIDRGYKIATRTGELIDIDWMCKMDGMIRVLPYFSTNAEDALMLLGGSGEENIRWENKSWHIADNSFGDTDLALFICKLALHRRMNGHQ